jgi:hypothetical protein
VHEGLAISPGRKAFAAMLARRWPDVAGAAIMLRAAERRAGRKNRQARTW